MTLETLPFDIADELHDDGAVAIYLDEALASGDPAYFAHALGKSEFHLRGIALASSLPRFPSR